MCINKPRRCFGELQTPTHFRRGFKRDLYSAHETGLPRRSTKRFLVYCRAWQCASLQVALKSKRIGVSKFTQRDHQPRALGAKV